MLALSTVRVLVDQRTPRREAVIPPFAENGCWAVRLIRNAAKGNRAVPFVSVEVVRSCGVSSPPRTRHESGGGGLLSTAVVITGLQ